jgi:hypothetical protein
MAKSSSLSIPSALKVELNGIATTPWGYSSVSILGKRPNSRATVVVAINY